MHPRIFFFFLIRDPILSFVVCSLSSLVLKLAFLGFFLLVIFCRNFSPIYASHNTLTKKKQHTIHRHFVFASMPFFVEA